jgi:hypothetical protein
MSTTESLTENRSFPTLTDDADNCIVQYSGSFDSAKVSPLHEERSFSYYTISFKPREKANLSSSGNSFSRLLSINPKSANDAENSLSNTKDPLEGISLYDPTDTDPFRHEIPM